jgi:hypothetical protein
LPGSAAGVQNGDSPVPAAGSGAGGGGGALTTGPVQLGAAQATFAFLGNSRGHMWHAHLAQKVESV